MALVLKDRVKETTTTTGTGTITLAGAVVGYQTFSAIGDSNTTYYVIEDADGAGWEVGIGTYTLSGTTLARTTVLASTNSNSQITLSSGTHTVFCGYPAGKSVVTDSPILVTPALGTPSALVATNATGTAASLTAGTATLATDATSITVSANNSADETVYPLFVDGATGSQGAETDTGLTYNPSSGLLTSTLFAGALTGNVTGDASGSSGSCTGNAATVTTNANLTGHITSTGNAAILGSFTVAQLSTALSDASISGNNTGDQTTVSGSSGSCTGNAATATVATTVTITDNESTAEDNAIIFAAGGDVDGGNIGLESDGTLTYNPSTGKITATGFIGALTGDASGSSGSCTGNAATVTTNANLTGHITSTGNAAVLGSFTVAQLSTALSDASISGSNTGDQTTVSGSSGSCTGNAATATVATTVTITDNESTAEDNAIIFAAGGDIDGGNLGLESDGTLTYNPSTGTVTSTVFAGALTGNVTGNASGSSGSCTGNAATVTTNANLTGHITSTGNAAILGSFTVAQLSTALSDASISGNNTGDQTTVSGSSGSCTGNAATATEATSITVSANNSANETVYPLFVDGATGSQGAETDTGLTYNPSSGLLTAAGFSGPLTGNVTGNASGTALTVTQAAQSAITSVGTLTSVVVADGGNIGSASDTDAISIGADGGVTLTKALIGPVGSGALSGSDTDVTIDWATGNYQEVTLNTANIDAVIFHNVTVGQRVIIRIQNDDVAPRTITWTVTSGTGTSPSSATVSWAGGTPPTITATVDKADTFGFICRSATTFDGFVIGQNI